MVRRESRERLVGIDWLEMYVNEGYGWDYTADGFRSRGYLVQEREYGTKTMAQMFTIMDAAGHPFIEIRREPRGLNTGAKQTVYKEGDSYVKLANMYCYDANPVGLMLDFLSREKYEIKKIYRIDLYTDFEIFDSGDKPANVVRRIVNHTYSKINQSHRRVSGTDTWTECFDNWISWGKQGSMVSTKIYDKTKELKETGMHKPYIVETWRRAGYVDDVAHLMREGQPVQMWRIEFSIKGNAKGWIYIDKNDSEDGGAHSLPHNLELYSTRQGVVNAIANLVPYYFRFKIYEEGKRKSLCKDKTLFIFSDDEYESGYRLTNESDTDRVRNVELEDDIIAVNHLVRAKMKLSGTEYDQELTDLITKLQYRIDQRSMKIYSKHTDIF
mgnify:CR=1 FL=1